MSEIISSTKDHLKRLAPFAKDIVIKTEKRKGHYLTKIRILGRGAILHAEKTGSNFWEALDSTYSAMVKQIERTKNKRYASRFKRKLQ